MPQKSPGHIVTTWTHVKKEDKLGLDGDLFLSPTLHYSVYFCSFSLPLLVYKNCLLLYKLFELFMLSLFSVSTFLYALAFF